MTRANARTTPGIRIALILVRVLAAAGWGVLAPVAAFAAAYTGAWEFDSPAGLSFDPARIEVANGVARLKTTLLPTSTALQLNVFGVNQYAQIIDDAQSGLGLGTDDFLFAAWIKPRSLQASHAVFQKRALVSGSPIGVLLQLEKVEGGYRLRASLSATGGAMDLSTPIAIREIAWVHIGFAVDRTRSTAQFYVNGRPFDQKRDISAISGSLSNPGAFRIGLDDISPRLVGEIDEVRFWRFSGGLPVNVDDIVHWHFENVTIGTANLAASWRFDSATGVDSAGSNHLVMVNNPTFAVANIYKVAEDGPYVQSSCVAGSGSDLYSADHRMNAGAGPVELRYQISEDGNTWWHYLPQSGWTVANGANAAEASLLYHLREHLADAPIQTGSFCFRAFFLSNGLSTLELDRLEVLAPPEQLALVALPAAGRPMPGSFHVIFETDYPAEAFIEYRKSANAPEGAWSDTPTLVGGTVFGIDVDGLDAGADYEYRVRLRPRGTSDAFAATATDTLPVAPVIDTASSIVFAVWGDSRPKFGEPLQPQAFYRLMEQVAGDQAVFHIAVGDNVNLSGAQPFGEEAAIDFYRGWRNAYDIAGGAGYMFFALGNHDEDIPEPARSVAARARLRSTVQPTDGDAAQRYYSWRWGKALFVAMDGSANNPKQAQAEWVLDKIAQPARWKFVFNHYPFFNSDRGIANVQRRDELHAGFQAAGVDIVFQAHDHWYADSIVDGIHYTTSGGAGSPLRPADQRFNPIVEYHYLRVELGHYSVVVNAIQVNEDGTPGPLLDRYCVIADDAPATDTDGDSEIDVCDADDDGDGVADPADNCRLVANADQRDTDDDDFGNVCDADFDNNGFVNFVDLARFRAAFGGSDPHADIDGNGFVNFVDLALFRGLFGKAPGPSGS